MTRGRLIAVVGPSGVGKDSVIAGIARALPGISVVRRTITRNPDAGGEVFDPVDLRAFEAAAARGDFCLHWGAHGLHYGIPAGVADDVRHGKLCIANLSRGVLSQAAAIFPDLQVLNVTASPETLAHRLSGRGRETTGEISERLARKVGPMPGEIDVTTISNDGALEDTVARAVHALRIEGVRL
ncbi:phosphonate metabolism protein/1,5-bisphosphokinase (PRPP-forming) PhnN [uncultured Roseobacter sp.]|uniref:phosphonate metabolism protein/1,5-bisphosphokinase (PRPP-forming) PhnN n=1 Tax=uncultured Roseobacter sp. TaxID=114847 RepID=UPI0026050F23|nr:phosphonate metabolism protein/1,5-bisphosphokinase (PRPP-forming) PhnN [uncultured Roseobacter sp.]